MMWRESLAACCVKCLLYKQCFCLLRSAVFRISPLEPFALIECFAKKSYDILFFRKPNAKVAPKPFFE